MGRPVLAAIRDATGRADVTRVRQAFEAVASAYGDRAPKLPVSIVVERMPIMGATESRAEGHLLHVAAHAARSEMLDGLIAHEVGHMVRTEERHPSHNKLVRERAMSRLKVPRGLVRGFGHAAREAVNHVQDVYADDLAIPLVIGDRTRRFFEEWIRSAASAPPDPWGDILGALSVAFSLGNMERHGFLRGDDPIRREAGEFARRRSVPSVTAWADLYRDLPEAITDPACVDLYEQLLSGVLREAENRP